VRSLRQVDEIGIDGGAGLFDDRAYLRESGILVPPASGVEVREGDEGGSEQENFGPRRERSPDAPMRSRVGRRGFLVGILIIPVLAAPNLARHALLARALIDRPPIERGHLASDEHRNFLARAGRPRLQARIAAEIVGDETKSAVANGWRWAFAASRHLPPDARIYLNLPNPLLYYYSTFFWFPRRVNVNPNPVVVSDAITLRAGAVSFAVADRPRLRELGYTHVVDSSPRGMRIFDLTRGDAGP
jgi:hypothetical protein